MCGKEAKLNDQGGVRRLQQQSIPPRPPLYRLVLRLEQLADAVSDENLRLLAVYQRDSKAPKAKIKSKSR